MYMVWCMLTHRHARGYEGVPCLMMDARIRRRARRAGLDLPVRRWCMAVQFTLQIFAAASLYTTYTYILTLYICMCSRYTPITLLLAALNFYAADFYFGLLSQYEFQIEPKKKTITKKEHFFTLIRIPQGIISIKPFFFVGAVVLINYATKSL